MTLRNLFLLLVLSLSCGILSAQINNIRLVDYKVVAVNPLTLDVTVRATIQNDTTDFSLPSVTCLAFKQSVPFVSAYATDIDLPHGQSKHKVVVRVDRCDGISLSELVRSALHFDANLYSADVSVEVRWSNGKVEKKSRPNVRLHSNGLMR